MSDPRATILIVEDEVLVRWAIADYLQDCGFKVLSASSAEEAIDALRQYALEIDIVFSDVRMPGPMDGFGLAAWIRKHRPEVAVIL
jgi:DNA-binding NtrC family response regulator